MGSRYTNQTISGYNSSPPPDDGTTVAANKITWAGIKTKLADALNTFIAAVNSQLVTFTDFSSVTTSTNLTTDGTHHMKTIEITSGSPTISLGDAASMTNNYIVTVTNTGTGAPVIALATAGNTLDGTANGTFTFPTGTKTSFTFKVNNGATGYYTEGIGGNKGALTLAGTLQGPSTMLSPITNSLSGDVTLNNIANYFDGPSVAQGTSGTWFAAATVDLLDSNPANAYFLKLWDGTTIISSVKITGAGGSQDSSVSLSGFITSPAGNIRVSVKCTSSTTAKIVFNSSGNSKDSTITAVRIA